MTIAITITGIRSARAAGRTRAGCDICGGKALYVYIGACVYNIYIYIYIYTHIDIYIYIIIGSMI